MFCFLGEEPRPMRCAGARAVGFPGEDSAKWADEPGSVVDDHLSTDAVTDAL